VTDYYALFGIPRGLNLSLDELQKRFYELSRELHPDRFMQKPEAERQRALDMSSALNDAYRTLKDPIKRAQYLLSQEGFDIGEQRSKDVPPELLEEVFELNMALEEMRGGTIRRDRNWSRPRRISRACWRRRIRSWGGFLRNTTRRNRATCWPRSGMF